MLVQGLDVLSIAELLRAHCMHRLVQALIPRTLAGCTALLHKFRRRRGECSNGVALSATIIVCVGSLDLIYKRRSFENRIFFRTRAEYDADPISYLRRGVNEQHDLSSGSLERWSN